MEYKSRPDNAEVLRACVEDAFAGTVYPSSGSIATNPDHCDECREADEFFRDRQWHELSQSGERLQLGSGGLSFLSPLAWRYFLPAYLLVGLSESEYAPDASWNALYAVSPPETADLQDYFMERATGFSLAQQECIAAYATAFSEIDPEDDIYSTVVAYWKRKVIEAKAKQEAISEQPHQE